MADFGDLAGLKIFERVVSLGSLTAAAEDLGISLAAASKRLANLERRTGTQLIQRSTRRLSVTEEGMLLHGYVQRALQELDLAEEALLRTQETVSGTLRITAPNSFGRRYLVGILPAFLEQYPRIDLQLILNDEVQDLITTGIDVAIRYGTLPDSRMVARKLLDNHRILCAAPEYLARCGTPRTLADLAGHQCIVLGSHPDAEWHFSDQTVSIHGSVCCNDGEAVHALALGGMGIALKSYWDVTTDFQAGRLVQVLPEYAESSAPINVVYLRRQNLASRVRVFIDYLAEKTRELADNDSAPENAHESG